MPSAFTEIEQILRRYDLEAENQRLNKRVEFLKRSRQATRAANKSLQKHLKKVKGEHAKGNSEN